MAICPSCRTAELEIFFEQPSVPAHSCLLLTSAEEARAYPRGTLRLGFCPSCGFISNTAFDTALNHYSDAYEETQGFSPTFRAFADSLAQRWIDRYDIRGKTILEIGCGKGEFLVNMCELGGNRGIGIDPSYIPERTATEAADRLTFLRELYSERHGNLDADVVVCRHTLEHIHPVGEFMDLVRRGIGDRRDVTVLFEVPDVLRVLNEVAFWDIYYEHCAYFSLGSLGRLFRATGFEIVDLSLDYDDQYLLIEARPTAVPASQEAHPLEDDMGALAAAVQPFASAHAAKLEQWRAGIGDSGHGARKTVIWGAGSKGVAYLSSLQLDDRIRYAVDINPFKQGMYLAGTGQQVVAPEFLREYRPDAVIAMNRVYHDEIRAQLDRMGVGAELISV
ncbi:MAG: class I SAM-dependent methyltransferase [Acidimicrobiales bacterium]